MKTIISILVSTALVPFAFGAGEATGKSPDNWPQWRGPLATGMAVRGDPPVEWDEKTNITWKTELPGSGSSTPIVWDDQVFVLTAIDTGHEADAASLPKPAPGFEKKTKAPTTFHQFVVMAIERQTGRIRWQQIAAEKIPHEGHHSTHTYAAASPVTDGCRLFVSFGSQGIFCYDLAGKLLWQRELGRMETRLGWGEATSPALHGDTLIVNWDHEAGSFIVALDAKNGQTRWKVAREEPTSWNTPLIVEYRGRTQVIVNGTNRIRSYDLATGEILWQCGGLTVNCIPSPVAADGIVYCMSGYRGAAAFAIPLNSTGDITGKEKVTWHYDRGTPYVPSPLLAGGRLYFTQLNDPLMTCLDTKTGKAVFDRQRLPHLTSLYASPTGVADRFYLPSREGTTLVIKRSDRFEVLATNRLDEPIDASPAIAGNDLFLRGDKHLYCIRKKDK